MAPRKHKKQDEPAPAKDLHWYKDAVIYEVHIKAFRDSNGDGIGDFDGLLEKLDYLKDLGITAIWLLPFYPSPLKDDGYDIADYYSINPTYGNIRKFKKFLDEAHKRDLKVITELVINHTSTQHEWFQRARRAPKGSPERDYYVWTDNPEQYSGVRIIFQDFEKSNWAWDEVAQQFYWHRFFFHQPDLNYDNPLVQEEVFRIMDFWCGMGVDGFRLDAVPYLFERDGTNCENLPETHDFLKKLRAYVDKHFPGTLLLAEANMWPEDSASYFGNGDECHMNYHFPVMPRMFMSLQMEDRYPIMDIYDQTPDIPDTCQWAIFLRNHDELTLEMVTDEERDYMYKSYVKDPKARINLGIRHRLAPLMQNNRLKIELLNYLLFSLPGTPVIYYGDEIGMGDNFYLGDRDGVRTPMQWSPDRNAGFSEANPQQLYLPVIIDPGYHYEVTNVEMQDMNQSSLLWWMKRLISTRKRFNAFSRGTMKFIDADNPKVLAFIRQYEEEVLLVIVNLSRYAQPAGLDLTAYAGTAPEEVFSRNKFPAIDKEHPYLFTMGPYDCYWFQLTAASAVAEEKKTAPQLKLNDWEDFTEEAFLNQLERNVLPGYLHAMRWFGGKGRKVDNIRIRDVAEIPCEQDVAYLLLVEVNYQEGLPDLYQLTVGFAGNSHAEDLKEGTPAAVIASCQVGKSRGVLFDALYGGTLRETILKFMASNHKVHVGQDEIRFSATRDLKRHVKERKRIRSNIFHAEQSNTSVIFDNRFFFKFYRKVDVAINPDLEVTRFLSEKAKFTHIPAFCGAIEWQISGKTIVLGMMQSLVENNGDAWTYMLDRLNDYNQNILSQKNPVVTQPKQKLGLLSPVNYNDLPEEMTARMDSATVENIGLLGIRTAEMHLALASSHDDPAFVPEHFSLHYQRSLFSSFQTLVRATFQNLSRQIRNLPAEIQEEAQEVLNRKNDILTALKRIYRKPIETDKIRIHGDYHLGQVLFTGKDFVILDFEGEPARSYSERRLKRSPLRDVAGMLRSFHYAAYGYLLLDNKMRSEDISKLIPFAEQWYRIMSRFYIQAYLERVKDERFIPKDQEDLKVLIQTFLLEKAIYELNYELNNRPGWVLVPIRGIQSVMKEIM